MHTQKLSEAILKYLNMPKEEVEAIAGHFKAITYKKGEIILAQGKVSDTYLFLAEGLIRSYLYDPEGNEVSMDFYTELNFVFEVGSFFTRKASAVNMEAVCDCEVLAIDFQTLNKLFHEKPLFRELGRAILVKSFVETKQWHYALISQSAEQRYQYILQHKAQILKQAPLKHIATYLGITDSTLSRIRAKIG